ncbi:hypothetical protein HK104_009269 [Borealophlyctis nickersoniae]|nr:hypothetical protein HK104_009269 [Borealophlyctis nickersoniae]
MTTSAQAATSDGPVRMGWEEYFATTPSPQGVEEIGKRTDEFIAFHEKSGKKVVLITSGGTTVPLETQTVRFIDNFSAGTRGATSAEYFIEAGYAVIFMHRQHSLQPYSRHYSHSKNCFLDYLEVGEGESVHVIPKYTEHMRQVLTKYQKAKQNNLLLMVDFVTVQDYLFLLRRLTCAMSRLGDKAMYYLAAAVSDFFIPQSKMAEHKIQSGDGALVLQLDQVPKIITPLVSQWAKKGFIVSFKTFSLIMRQLETDPSILVSKAKKSLERYGHQLVIGNILTTRKRIVTLITQTEQKDIVLSDEELAAGVEIESRIVPELVERHDRWIKEQRS